MEAWLRGGGDGHLRHICRESATTASREIVCGRSEMMLRKTCCPVKAYAGPTTDGSMMDAC